MRPGLARGWSRRAGRAARSRAVDAPLYGWRAFAAGLSSRASSPRTACSIPGRSETPPGKSASPAALFENANLRGAACLHALCLPEAEAIRAYGLKNPICVIPNGVDIPERRSPRAADRTARPCSTSAGCIRRKACPDLLRAWKKVRREPWDLVIAGWDEGGHEAELRELAAAEGVRFPGPLFDEAKRDAFQQCDGFILPSLSEGLPMVLLEAWASGKPVLMTPQCNLPEGFAAGAAVRIETERGWHRARPGGFLRARTTRQRSDMGQRGLRLVRERFSWPAIAARNEAVSTIGSMGAVDGPPR